MTIIWFIVRHCGGHRVSIGWRSLELKIRLTSFQFGVELLPCPQSCSRCVRGREPPIVTGCQWVCLSSAPLQIVNSFGCGLAQLLQIWILESSHQNLTRLAWNKLGGISGIDSLMRWGIPQLVFRWSERRSRYNYWRFTRSRGFGDATFRKVALSSQNPYQTNAWRDFLRHQSFYSDQQFVGRQLRNSQFLPDPTDGQQCSAEGRHVLGRSHRLLTSWRLI